MNTYIVYMLHCADGSYYTGITNNLSHRLSQHAEGINPSYYTFTRRPLTLVYNTVFLDVRNAIAWEKTLKRWSRSKKEALIKGDQEGLEKYARGRYRKRIDAQCIATNKSVKSVMVSSTNHGTSLCRPSSSSG